MNKKIMAHILNNYQCEPHTGHITKHDNPKVLGCLREKTGYLDFSFRLNGKSYRFSASHIAWLLYYKRLPNGTIDHIDGNRSNNRISNLRECSRQDNARNRTKGKASTTSRFKGVVCYPKLSENPWRAYITHNRKMISLGYFPTEIEAAQAYDAKAFELFGKFAQPNLLDGEPIIAISERYFYDTLLAP